MQESLSTSGWDTWLLGVPFLALLFCGFFRLDQVFASRKPAERARPFMSGVDEDGEPIVCDPDGTMSGKPRVGRGLRHTPAQN